MDQKFGNNEPTMKKSLKALKKVLGAEHKPTAHTLNWTINQLEKNIGSGGCWSKTKGVPEAINKHVLKKLKKLRGRVNTLMEDCLPTSYRFSGTIQDITFDTGTLDNLVQQNSTTNIVSTRNVLNPINSNATTTNSFTRRASVQESVTLSVESLQEQLVEQFSELRVSNHSTTQLGGGISASLFGLIELGGSVTNTSSQTTNSTNNVRTREANLERNGRTITISSNTSYDINNTLEARPGTNIRQDCLITVAENLNIPFEADLLVRATKKRNNRVSDANRIEELLEKSYGVRNVDILSRPDANSLLCRVRGNMRASLGLDMVDRITNLP